MSLPRNLLLAVICLTLPACIVDVRLPFQDVVGRSAVQSTSGGAEAPTVPEVSQVKATVVLASGGTFRMTVEEPTLPPGTSQTPVLAPMLTGTWTRKGPVVGASMQLDNGSTIACEQRLRAFLNARAAESECGELARLDMIAHELTINAIPGKIDDDFEIEVYLDGFVRYDAEYGCEPGGRFMLETRFAGMIDFSGVDLAAGALPKAAGGLLK